MRTVARNSLTSGLFYRRGTVVEAEVEIDFEIVIRCGVEGIGEYRGIEIYLHYLVFLVLHLVRRVEREGSEVLSCRPGKTSAGSSPGRAGCSILSSVLHPEGTGPQREPPLYAICRAASIKTSRQSKGTA